MNASQLASKMLEWETKRRELDTLEAEIKQAVIELGKSQSVGNVTARYSNGRTTRDYLAGVQAYEQEARSTFDHDAVELLGRIKNETSKTVYDWRAICDNLDLDAPVKSQGKPSVSLKIKE